jgi:hypothetical protein
MASGFSGHAPGIQAGGAEAVRALFMSPCTHLKHPPARISISVRSPGQPAPELPGNLCSREQPSAMAKGTGE